MGTSPNRPSTNDRSLLAVIIVRGAKFTLKISFQYIGAGTKGDKNANSLGVISSAQYDKFLFTVIRQCVQSENE